MRRLLVLPLLLAACSTGDTGSGGDALVPDDTALGELAVEQDPGNGSAPQRWTLVCGTGPEGDGGDHPDPGAACTHLRGLDAPFAPLPDDQLCSQQYGGPQTARITGTWRGESVDLRLSRTDGCRIGQWDGLGPVLPGPVGVEPPS